MKKSDFLSQIRQYENRPMSREHLRRLVEWAVKKERAECALDALQIGDGFSAEQIASILAARGEEEDI